MSEQKTFTLSEVETERYYEFIERHRKCKKETTCALNEIISVIFTESGIGVFKQARCAHCDTTENITDFANW